MARIRTIKPEFWTSEQVTECSLPARLLFIGLWNFCDDYGVHPASPRRLKMQIFPGDDITTADVERMMNELIAAELVSRFESGGAEYLWVTGWDKHQKIEKPNKKYPSPPAQGSEAESEIADQSGSGSGKVVELSPTARRPLADSSPPEGKGREVEVEVEKNSDPNGSASVPDDPEREMWDAGKALLAAGGVSAAKAGSIIGRWRREYGNEPTLAAIRAAEKDCVSDPVAFCMACLVENARRKRSRAPPKSFPDGIIPMHPGAGG